MAEITHKLDAGDYVEVAGVQFIVLTHHSADGKLIDIRLKPIDKKYVQPAFRYCDYGRIW